MKPRRGLIQRYQNLIQSKGQSVESAVQKRVQHESYLPYGIKDIFGCQGVSL